MVVGRLLLQTALLRVCYSRIPYMKGSSSLSGTESGGCSVSLTEDDNSFGPGFNDIRGGWWVPCLAS